MNCEHVRTLILTDHADGQLPAPQAARVENHLMHCPSCRLLAEKVRRDTIVPLNGVQRAGPDEFVWLRLKQKLQQDEVVEHAGVGIADIVRHFLYPLRPVAVVACLFVMVSAGLLVRGSFMQQPYLSYVLAGDSQGSDEVSAGIEQYFL